MIVTAGKTNVSVYYYIVQDASATSPGEPVTGLLFSDIETGGSASYARQGAARVDLTLITLGSASATHADGGFILVDDTNMPGLYRCDYPDAAFITGVDQVMLQIVVASGKNAVASPIFVEITDVDLRDNVRGGMTAIPNAAADAAGGLVISDAGGLDMDSKLANTNEITVARMGALTDWINGGRLDLILDIIAADTTTDIPALIATAQADLDIITGADGVNLLSGTQTSIDAIEVDTGTTLPANQTIINDNVLLIDTAAMRGTDEAALASVCTEGRLAELAAANLPADIDGIKAVTVQFAFTVANNVDSNLLVINGDTQAAANFERSAIALQLGAAIAGTLSTTEMTTDLTEVTDDHFNGRIVIWTTGVLKNQATDITDYDGTTKKLTYTATTEAPSATDEFVIA